MEKDMSLFLMNLIGIAIISAGFVWALYRSETRIRNTIQQMDRTQEKYIKQRDLDRHSEKRKKV
jgi:hypothetical protein